MNLKSLLNQALNSDIVNQTTQKASQSSSSIGQALGDKKTLGALGAGAVGGGLLGMLMGSKKTKKMGKTALGVGGAAALGALAYKLYNDYNKGESNPSSSPQTPANFTQTSQHDESVLKAMIAAAKADGHIDEQEMAKIEQALTQIDADTSVQQLIQAEIAKPLDPSEIARLAVSPEHATEIYLASLLVADEQNFMEKAYLKELATQLGLEGGLVEQLNAQVSQ